VWELAGDSETAVPFYEHASRLAPDDDKFACMYLSALRKAEPAAALTRAWEIVAEGENHQPLVMAQAAYILATSTRGMPPVDARPVLQQLTQVLERGLQKLQNGEPTHLSALESTHASVPFLLGFCHERLGDFRTALHYYNLGLAADPTNATLLIARGILRYGVESGAVDDFEQAIRYGSPTVSPYLFLAHHYLVNKRFEDCRRVCDRALEFPADDEVRANFKEWLAISEAELGFPPERIRSTFEAAMRLAPEAEHIRRNLDEFARAEAQEGNRHASWLSPNSSVIQEVGRAASLPIPA